VITIYTQIPQGKAWTVKYSGCVPTFVCVLGFTETALIPGISAAGSSPEDRKYTACADAEFLYYGAKANPQYPLPPLTAGASPVLISRAVVEELKLPLYIFNAGLLQPPAVPAIDLGGTPALCLSNGKAMSLGTVEHLLEQGLIWGERLTDNLHQNYLVLSECVVGGTTTALSILTGLGINAAGKVNSSHPTCNHEQKWAVVEAGLREMGRWRDGGDGGDGKENTFSTHNTGYEQRTTDNGQRTTDNGLNPLKLVAAVGDPMQIVVAGMAIAASRRCGVMLGGGTQMLAVYALARALAHFYNLLWDKTQIVIGTTRWVACDPTGATIELAQLIGDVPIIATELNFHESRYLQLRAYEQGFVKEGVGAGAACIAAHLSQNWQQHHLLNAIEAQLEHLDRVSTDVI
jgi:NaMN:DMB phosphoribosyltransferase